MQSADGSYDRTGCAVNRVRGLRTLEATFFVRRETCEELDKTPSGGAPPNERTPNERTPSGPHPDQLGSGPGSGPCSASNSRLTRANTSSARSRVAASWVAITLVRSSAPPGGTAGCSAVLTNTPAS